MGFAMNEVEETFFNVNQNVCCRGQSCNITTAFACINSSKTKNPAGF